MPELLNETVVQTSIAVVILCVLIAAAVFFLSSFRDYVVGDHETVDDPLANLEEMLRNGDITDQEFRTIQASTQQPQPLPEQLATTSDSPIVTSPSEHLDRSGDSAP